MKKTYKEWLKYYENATKEQVIEDMMLDIKEIDRLNNIIEADNRNYSNLVKEWKKQNNIINELEKWLNKMEQKSWDYYYYAIVDVLDKLKELKENK